MSWRPPIVSPEEAMRRTGQAQQPQQEPQPQPSPQQAAAAGPSGYPSSPFMGFTPKHAMEGFDFSREQNIQKSAKDAFAYLSNQAPPPPLHDKQALSVWFKQYIQPGMQQLGHNVTDVQGDKFRFNNWQGDFWTDYGRGAGAQGGALAWQADYAAGGPSNQAYNQTQQAIMGVPRQNSSAPMLPRNTTMPIQQAVLARAPEPTAEPSTDLSQYYEYLSQFLAPER